MKLLKQIKDVVILELKLKVAKFRNATLQAKIKDLQLEVKQQNDLIARFIAKCNKLDATLKSYDRNYGTSTRGGGNYLANKTKQ